MQFLFLKALRAALDVIFTPEIYLFSTYRRHNSKILYVQSCTIFPEEKKTFTKIEFQLNLNKIYREILSLLMHCTPNVNIRDKF